jgi:hypothetical protein
MTILKYAKIDTITKRLAGRITVVDIVDQGITGITSTQIGTDLIYVVGESVEEFIDMYLTMIYEMPLKNSHSFIQSIADKLIISEVYSTYFPTQLETNDNTGSFSSILRLQALNDFQCLFEGLGIYVPGSTSISASIQNDENKNQMSVKAVILPGERVKKYIGHDFDGDNISDSDLFKLNSNISPSFYSTGQFEKLGENETSINNIRVRPKGLEITDEISFY